jgi:hypothetical protein
MLSHRADPIPIHQRVSWPYATRIRISGHSYIPRVSRVTDLHRSRSLSTSKIGDLSVFMDLEIDSIMHFFWLRGASNEQIMSQIKQTYEDGVIYLRSVQQGIHAFAAGRTELDALRTPTWLIDPENTDRIRKPLESELYISQKTLSRRLNLRHHAIHRISREELGFCNVNFK